MALLAASEAYAVRGYQSRACGLDINGNGVSGECANHAGGPATCPDCSVCSGLGGVGGQARDFGGGTVAQEVYVNCALPPSSDNPGCGNPGAPCRTINQALNVIATGNLSIQSVVCFKGTCANEPDNMPYGPATLGNLGTRTAAGLSATYTVPRTGNQVRSFLHAKTPTMLIGWDADNDGDYPPHDAADIAVVNGAGKNRFLSGEAASPDGAPTYFEAAHFSARDFGTQSVCNATGASRGFADYGHTFGTAAPQVYWHDLELTNIDKQQKVSDATIIFAIANSDLRSLDVSNVRCLDCGGIFLRGEPVDQLSHQEAGPIRVQNITWRAFGADFACDQNAGGTGVGTGGGAELGKIWGTVSNIEILDGIGDMNLAAWSPGNFRYMQGWGFAECTQNVDVINWLFIDNLDGGIQLKQKTVGTPGVCNTRPVDNIRILRDEFRATFALPGAGPNPLFNFGAHIFLDGVNTSSGGVTDQYIGNVTIADCFFWQGNGGVNYGNAILSTTGRNGTGISGCLTIANNTFDGAYNPAQGGGFASPLQIQNAFGYTNPQKCVVLENNIFSHTGARNIINWGECAGAPCVVMNDLSQTTMDFNNYDPAGTFRLAGGTPMTFLAWRNALGPPCPSGGNECDSTGSGTSSPRLACVPSYVSAATGDLHLKTSAPPDTCASSFGTDLSGLGSSFLLDIDATAWFLPWSQGADNPLGAPPPTTTTSTTSTTSTTGTGPTSTTTTVTTTSTTSTTGTGPTTTTTSTTSTTINPALTVGIGGGSFGGGGH